MTFSVVLSENFRAQRNIYKESSVFPEGTELVVCFFKAIKYLHVSKLNKRCVNSPSVNCRPFASEVVFWAILKNFEIAVYCSPKYHFWGKRTTIYRGQGNTTLNSHIFFRNKTRLYYGLSLIRTKSRPQRVNSYKPETHKGLFNPLWVSV